MNSLYSPLGANALFFHIRRRLKKWKKFRGLVPSGASVSQTRGILYQARSRWDHFYKCENYSRCMKSRWWLTINERRTNTRKWVQTNFWWTLCLDCVRSTPVCSPAGYGILLLFLEKGVAGGGITASKLHHTRFRRHFWFMDVRKWESSYTIKPNTTMPT